MTDPIQLLESWLASVGKNHTWSIRGPSKGVRNQRYQVTLYEYRGPRWNNVASKAGGTLLEAVEAAISLWEERWGVRT